MCSFNAKLAMSNSTSLSTPRHRKRRRREESKSDNKMMENVSNYFKYQNSFLVTLKLVLFNSIFVISLCGAFNLDTRVPIVKSGIASGSLDESYFGYSVA